MLIVGQPTSKQSDSKLAHSAHKKGEERQHIKKEEILVPVSTLFGSELRRNTIHHLNNS